MPKAEVQRREKVVSAIRLAEERLIGESSLINEIKNALEELDGVDVDAPRSASIIKLEELKELLKEKIEALSAPTLSDNDKVIGYLKDTMPKYVYYSNYGNLDSQIYLPQVLQNLSRDNLGLKDAAKARTLKTLFRFVGLDPKEITEMGMNPTSNPSPEEIERIARKKKEREILLSSASSSFTKAFKEWWKQGDYAFEFQADGDFSEYGCRTRFGLSVLSLRQEAPAYNGFLAFIWFFLLRANGSIETQFCFLMSRV